MIGIVYLTKPQKNGKELARFRYLQLVKSVNKQQKGGEIDDGARLLSGSWNFESGNA